MRSLLLPRLQLLAAAVLFSTGGAAIKASRFDAWQLTSLRSAVAAAALLLALPAARRRWDLRVAATGTAFAATTLLFVAANKLTTAAHTIFLQSTAPLYLLLLGPWLLAEPIRRRDLGFMALMGGGLALFFAAGQEPLASAPAPGRGNLLALGAGLTWAITVVGLRSMSRGEGAANGGAPRTVVAGNVIAALACLPAALPIAGTSAADWALVAYLGVFQLGLAYVFVLAAIRRLAALEAAMLLLVEPALNPLWAWLVQGERPAPLALAGAALVFAATGVKAWSDSRTAPASAPPAA